MTPVEAGLRRILLLLAAATCVAIPVELLLVEHTGSATQLLPFGVLGLALAAILAAALRPGRITLRVLQGTGGLLVLTGLLGIWEHLEGNWRFAAEIQPGADGRTLLVEALLGANPLLAPGSVALAGLLAAAAAWRHPELVPRG